ncbi:MAG TPA: tagaturonate reductase [Cyclobacteriaceae bacterium]|nr:tagaturonate reductase [Cyclobacteriaceae bacterium]
MLKPLNRITADAMSRSVKVLQFGEGNFLRAFVDWIIDILNEKTSFNGDVQVVQPIRNGMGETINQQDGLYHLVLNGIKNGKATTEIRLITCLREVINPYENFEAFLETGENADLRFIFSNTTEAGIAFNPDDKDPNRLPESFPGKMTALLFHRYKHFKGARDKGLFIIPCELIDKNGQQLREIIFQFISLWKLPDDFKKWVSEHNTFCNTLVDRIVPGYPKETIKEIQEKIGYDDHLVVTAEPFHLWVIEGPESVRKAFPADKADLDVKFVNDQSPYRTRKVRILNGAHTAMVPVAYLHGLRTVKESVEDPFVGEFIKQAINEEIIPTLDLPHEELNQFAHDVIERFQNPFIRHELSSIALNSISKFKVRVLPSILEYNGRKNTLPDRLVFSLACLIAFYKGDWQGTVTPVSDSPEIMAFFKEVWRSSNVDDVTKTVLSNQSFWDTDLTSVPGLTNRVSTFLLNLEKGNVINAWDPSAIASQKITIKP